VCLEEEALPLLLWVEGAAKGRGVPPQVGLGWRAGLGRRLLPQVGSQLLLLVSHSFLF